MFSGRRMMMKKLLVLLTVLAMASAASASMSIVAPSQVMNSEQFAIGVDVVGESALITDVLVVAGNASLVDASGVGLAAIKPGVDPYFDDFSSDPNFLQFASDLGITNVKALYYYEFVDVAVPPAVLADGALVSNILVTAGAGSDDVVIGLLDAANGVIRSTANVQVVPEPMTIALLGLGGLFLRRRK
jgi:hypothetical protein